MRDQKIARLWKRGVDLSLAMGRSIGLIFYSNGIDAKDFCCASKRQVFLLGGMLCVASGSDVFLMGSLMGGVQQR